MCVVYLNPDFLIDVHVSAKFVSAQGNPFASLDRSVGIAVVGEVAIRRYSESWVLWYVGTMSRWDYGT